MSRSVLSTFRSPQNPLGATTVVYDNIASVAAGSLLVIGWSFEGGFGDPMGSVADTIDGTPSGKTWHVYSFGATRECGVAYCYDHPGGSNVVITGTVASGGMRGYREGYGAVLSGTVGEINPRTLAAATSTHATSGATSFSFTMPGDGTLFASVASVASLPGFAATSPATLVNTLSTPANYGACMVQATTGAGSKTIASTGGQAALINGIALAFNDPTVGGPVLSSPTIVSTGNTIATVRVTTDTAPTGSSILAVQVLPAADATPTAAAILAAPTQTITSGASGARDFNLTGLTNGAAYKAHSAQTGPSNMVSTASFTPSTVPGAPTIGTATAGNAQATVNGTAPGSTGGSEITGYRSTATPGGSTVTGASLPITHTGLTNGAAYTFTLAAQNANGYGAESAASNSVTPSSGADVTPPTLGGSITIGTVTSSSIQASWSAGSDNVAVTSYEVSSNGGGSYSDVGNVLTYTFTGLAPSTSYALRVRAKDAAGNVSSALSATQSTGAAPSSITGTFTLPGADDRTDKQEVTLHTVQALSSLTVDGNGATVNGAPASLAANGFFRLRFDAQSVAWYRVG